MTTSRLTQEKVAVSAALVTELVSGCYSPKLLVKDTVGRLVYQLNAFVLTESADKPECKTDRVTVDLPLRPWWLPAFAWRRIPTRRARFTLAVVFEPRYRYPSSTLAVPELGAPVRYVTSYRLDGENGARP